MNLSAISKGQDVKALIKSPRIMGDPVLYKKEPLAAHSSRNFNNEAINQDNQGDRILIESNLCHEVGMTVLNILSLFIGHHKVGMS